MISSRIFTASLRYEVDSNSFNDTCEQLRKTISETFESDDFTRLVNIITAEYNVKIDKKSNPNVDIVVMIYATVDSTVESNKGFTKLMELFIDTHCEMFTINNTEAKLIKRRVI